MGSLEDPATAATVAVVPQDDTESETEDENEIQHPRPIQHPRFWRAANTACPFVYDLVVTGRDCHGECM